MSNGEVGATAAPLLDFGSLLSYEAVETLVLDGRPRGLNISDLVRHGVDNRRANLRVGMDLRLIGQDGRCWASVTAIDNDHRVTITPDGTSNPSGTRSM